jgi:hypothetical protein
MDSEPYTAASTASNQLAQRSVINITVGHSLYKRPQLRGAWLRT